jgi:hypothetical protein
MYAADFSGLLEAVGARDTALMTIKTIARRNWQDDEQHRYDTWYAPFDEQLYISAAVTWVLKTYPQVTGIATVGETRLLRQMIVAEAASRRRACLCKTQRGSWTRSRTTPRPSPRRLPACGRIGGRRVGTLAQH